MLHWNVLASGNAYHFCLMWIVRFLKSVWVLTKPPKHALSNLPHLTATLDQDEKGFYLASWTNSKSLGFTPYCHGLCTLVSHCESFVNVVMVSLQNVLKKKLKSHHLNTCNKNNFSVAGFVIPPEDQVAKLWLSFLVFQSPISALCKYFRTCTVLV